MSNPIFLPFRGLGWIFAAGIAGAVGWNLGRYLAEVITGERESPWSELFDVGQEEESEPLWKKKFGPITGP